MMEIIYNFINCNSQCNEYIFDTFDTFYLYWFISLIFTCLDYTQPKWYMKYKIQKNSKLTWKRIKQMIKTNLFNQIVVTPIFLLFWYKLLEWRGLDQIEPTFFTIITHFAVMFLITEFLFYKIHIIFHKPYFFKHIHKTHHDELNPSVLSSYNNHPIEHLLSILFTNYVGHLVMGSHIKVFKYWINIGTLVAIYFHCGVHFPLLVPNEFHDYHHLKYNQCYGLFGLFDYIYGTDKEYRKSKQYQRHKIYNFGEEYPLV
jgi:sterol desaturase/sphingolipid hydroxylase (fatty acid hydroxylase superfamily)